ncbi:MAG: hypothetical protein SNH13_02790 [Rikenellaceae bacterium]
MKQRSKFSIIVALLAVSISISASANDILPVKLTSFTSEVKYASKPDYSISDEFDSDAKYEQKWKRRILPTKVGKSVDQNDPSLVTFESDNDVKYISFKGVADDDKGKNIRTSGIISQKTAYGGFYVTRFRILGLDTEKCKTHGTIWHPSIWCAKWGKDYDTSNFKKNESWLEIDFIEWEGKSWSCDAPARFLFSNGVMGKVNDRDKVDFGAIKASVLDEKDNLNRDHTQWTTLGLEYNSKFIKIWEYKDGKWINISSRTVDFVDENPNRLEDSFRQASLGKSAYKPVIWVLGNVTSPWMLGRLTGDNDAKRPSCEDMSIDIDFFRYYPCLD